MVFNVLFYLCSIINNSIIKKIQFMHKYYYKLTLMILVPDPDEPVIFCRCGKEKPVRRECQEVDGIGRSDLPNAGPARAPVVGDVLLRSHCEPDFRLYKQNKLSR